LRDTPFVVDGKPSDEEAGPVANGVVVSSIAQIPNTTMFRKERAGAYAC